MKIFCNSGCKESWRTDRRYCLIYPPINVEGKLVGWYDWHVENGYCPYCSHQVVKYRKFAPETNFYFKFEPNNNQWLFVPKFEIKKFTFGKIQQINGWTLKKYKEACKKEYKKYWKFAGEVSEKEHLKYNEI